MPLRHLMPLLVLLSLAILPLATPTAHGQSSATVTPHISEDGTIVGAEAVNIRACPRLDCAVVTTAKLGASLTVTGDATGGFLPVTIGNETGHAYDLFVATASRGTPELRQGLPGCSRVAFIFNIGVGYEPDLTILDWLKANKIPATLFPMGWWATENQAILNQMARDGFLIGSHGDERAELTNRPDGEVIADLEQAIAAIEQATGDEPAPYFTPYAGAMDERIRGIVARAGYIPVSWDVPAADWDFEVTPDDVFMSVVPNVVDGSIVEFHLDAPSSAKSTGVAIRWIVDRLQTKGYDFVTIAEMALPCPDANATPRP
ncbi:MAG: polysaccharide deacetylase family protein [Chloroflexia bacterium]|nr:polysaccharide deacetylase family protein [Chloroflexia bacterium]